MPAAWKNIAANFFNNLDSQASYLNSVSEGVRWVLEIYMLNNLPRWLWLYLVSETHALLFLKINTKKSITNYWQTINWKLPPFYCFLSVIFIEITLFWYELTIMFFLQISSFRDLFTKFSSCFVIFTVNFSILFFLVSLLITIFFIQCTTLLEKFILMHVSISWIYLQVIFQDEYLGGIIFMSLHDTESLSPSLANKWWLLWV